MKKVYIAVSNDLATDQRVHKHALTLMKAGFDVILVGAAKKGRLPLNNRTYKTIRLPLFFSRSALFYAEFNIRLFFFLLFKKARLFFSNDLDTLPAVFLASKLRGLPIIYDSHEYFTEVPEIVDRPLVQNTWKGIEKMIFPRLKTIVTINDSIADLYSKKYHKDLIVVRNLPLRSEDDFTTSRRELGLPEDKKIIVLQGSGINIQRGAEEALQSMAFLHNCLLMIIGGGDVLNILKKEAEKPELEDKVVFFPRMPHADLVKYTSMADIGLTLDKDTNINYRYSLPNKLFDYIHAQIPVLSSPLPEITKIIRKYNIGNIIPDHQPENIAKSIQAMISSPEMMKIWKENLKIAKAELCWENDEIKLLDVYKEFS